MDPLERDEPSALNYASRRTRPARRIVPQVLGGLITLAALSGLAALSIRPGIGGYGIDGERKFTMARVDEFASVLELYRLHLGAYPASLDDLSRLPAGTTAKTWQGPYIDNTDRLKDAWGRPLRYRFPGIKNVGAYDLWSIGLDGVSGTKDDICNWP
jgi:general secretion pathway protein G